MMKPMRLHLLLLAPSLALGGNIFGDLALSLSFVLGGGVTSEMAMVSNLDPLIKCLLSCCRREKQLGKTQEQVECQKHQEHDGKARERVSENKNKF